MFVFCWTCVFIQTRAVSVWYKPAIIRRIGPRKTPVSFTLLVVCFEMLKTFSGIYIIRSFIGLPCRLNIYLTSEKSLWIGAFFPETRESRLDQFSIRFVKARVRKVLNNETRKKKKQKNKAQIRDNQYTHRLETSAPDRIKREIRKFVIHLSFALEPLLIKIPFPRSVGKKQNSSWHSRNNRNSKARARAAPSVFAGIYLQHCMHFAYI